MNRRITAKERNLLKGAIRRVFSRSEIRKTAIDKAIIVGYADSSRPKVKTWVRCSSCQKPEAKSYIQVDHEIPIVPVDSALEFMRWDEVVDRTWCEESNLKPICKPCHIIKSKSEMKQRSKNKKERKLNGQPSKTTPLATKKRSKRSAR